MDVSAGKAVEWLKVATDILVVKNPFGTALGTVSGVAVHGALIFASPLVPLIRLALAAGFNVIYTVCMFVALFNLRPFLRRHAIPEQIEEVLALIDREEASKRITKADAALRRKQVIDSVLASLQPSAGSSDRRRKRSTGRGT